CSALHEIGKRLGCPFLIAEDFKIVGLRRPAWVRRWFCDDPLKNRTHCAHSLLQRRGEVFTGRKPEAECEMLQSVRVSRNKVRLLFGLYLQTMLHAAEEPVRIITRQHFIVRKEIQLAKRSQRFEHIRFLQKRVTRSMDKLQCLHDEFDLANTTASKLYVALELVRPDYVALDAPLDTGNFIQQIGRRAFRVNKRLMLSQEFVS